MPDHAAEPRFASINRGYDSTFRLGRLSIGLVVPLEAYPDGAVPTMEQQRERIQLAERLGFAAVWLRDVPFNDPSFGDAGQVFDPFVYLGVLAASTDTIALGVASIILPLRHPAHVAKASASVDQLSGGRLILGVASGDRPTEYPALGVAFDQRSKRFRDSVAYIRGVAGHSPRFDNAFGSPRGIDLLPKPAGARLPLLVTGSSRQSPTWIAEHADGWMTYPRPLAAQARALHDWRERVEDAGRAPQPVLQPLYIDLDPDPAAGIRPIHLGFRTGLHALVDYLESLERIGVHHVALNLRFNRNDVPSTLEALAKGLLPRFPSPSTP
jgi:luciferase-type oxidoreductase